MNTPVHLRPASASDREFLFTLHCTTMREVIATTWGWDEAFQQADFDRRFAQAIVWIVETQGCAVGSLWVEWKPDSLYIHELQVLPAFQGRGLGTAIIQHAIEQGASRALPVTLSVVPATARARYLYERLGFEVTHIDPPFIHMRNNSGLTGGPPSYE
jgi:ribosomal protein S18 acetylase RimI-like enzyme